MSYTIEIKNNHTGEIRKCKFPEPDDEFSEFLWSEGNYACDCNRHLFFTDHEDSSFPCGDEVYSIIDVYDNSSGKKEKTDEMRKFLDEPRDNLS